MLKQPVSSFPRALKSLLVGATVTVASLAMVLPAAADSYPERPLNMVVGFGTGGSADRLARLMSGYISEEIGVPIQVTNRPGAGTQVASNYVLNVPDDAYTVYASTFAPYLTNSILTGGANFSVDDFSYINFQWFDLDLIAANKDSGYDDLPSLLEAIREQRGQVRGAVVQGSAGHLMLETFKAVTGADIQGIPYKGAGPAMVDFIAGQTQVFAISSTLALGQVRSGKARAVAVAGPSRSAAMCALKCFMKAPNCGPMSVNSGCWHRPRWLRWSRARCGACRSLPSSRRIRQRSTATGRPSTRPPSGCARGRPPSTWSSCRACRRRPERGAQRRACRSHRRDRGVHRCGYPGRPGLAHLSRPAVPPLRRRRLGRVPSGWNSASATRRSPGWACTIRTSFA